MQQPYQQLPHYEIPTVARAHTNTHTPSFIRLTLCQSVPHFLRALLLLALKI